jgi:rare lipoprotein A
MTKSTTRVAVRLRTCLSGSVIVAASVVLAGCATSNTKSALLSGAEPVERVVGPHDKVPPGGGRYQVGKPYTIGGRTYYPHEDPDLDQSGVASWYGGDYHHGTRTANGEVVDRDGISAAHKTMPLPSYARVTNLKNGRSIVVRVNDRGPYVGSRVIDLSEKTAELLEMKQHGLGKVRVQYLGRAGLAGSDQRILAATLTGPGLNSGHDERTLLAQADLGSGPRRNVPAAVPTMVASASPTLFGAASVPRGAAQASLFNKSRFAPPVAAPAPVRVTTVAFAPVTDAYSLDLAGVDPRTMRAAMIAAKPVASSAEVIAAAMPRASGGPMSILPGATGSSSIATTEPGQVPLSGLPSRSSSYATTTRISTAHAIFAPMGEGERLARLID